MTDKADRKDRAAPAAEPPMAFGERLTCSVAEASKAVGLSRSKLYELMSGGEVQSVTIGRRRLVSVSSLMRLTGTPQPRPGVPA
jgi:excisionase family DNA binding protein